VTAIDRLLAALREIIREEFPALTFLGVYEYVVQHSSGSTADLAPTSTTIGLPDLPAVRLDPSILGEVVSGAKVGSVALVEFVNGDPTRPAVVSLSLPSSTATIDATGTLQLGPSARSVELAGGGAPVARQGDAVTVYLPVTVACTGTINGTIAFVGTLTFPGPAVGIVAGGNPKVTA
jgi:hypothetical protein